MNAKIRQHLEQHCKAHGYEISDDMLWEVLKESGDRRYRELVSEHRWYDEYFCVVEIDGLEIGYVDAHTTGDRSAYEIGWEYDLDAVCEVTRHEETKVVVTYTPKESDDD